MKNLLLSFLFLSFMNAQNLMTEAKTLFNNSDYSKAKDVLKSIVDEDEENAEAWFFLAKSYYHLNEFEESVDSFDEFINDQTTDIDQLKWYVKANEKYVHEASIFSRMSIAKTIMETYRKILKIDPNDLETERHLIGFLMNAPGIAGGDTDEALQRLEKLKIKSPFIANLILFRYYLKEDNQSEAEKCLNNIVASENKDDDYFVLYNTYGYYLLNKKEFEKALNMFLKQVELAPDNANSYDSLGDGYKALNNIPKAIEAYKKAILLDPNLEASINNLKELED